MDMENKENNSCSTNKEGASCGCGCASKKKCSCAKKVIALVVLVLVVGAIVYAKMNCSSCCAGNGTTTTIEATEVVE